MVRSGNSGEVSTIVPRDILNLGVIASYICPIALKGSWTFSLGCGVYSQPAKIGFNSILANGGCIIIYDINTSLSVGLGIGLTNSFGVPMIMPTGYLKWVVKKRFELDVDLTKKSLRPGYEWCGWATSVEQAIQLVSRLIQRKDRFMSLSPYVV